MPGNLTSQCHIHPCCDCYKIRCLTEKPKPKLFPNVFMSNFNSDKGRQFHSNCT